MTLSECILRIPVYILRGLKILIPVLRCQHKFYIEDIRLTGIEFKPKPIGRPYEEWSTYYSELN